MNFVDKNLGLIYFEMSDSKEKDIYVYNMPYNIRKSLCSVLDLLNSWEELGGCHMGYDIATLHYISQAVQRNASPTNELLQLWGTKNHTVLELYFLLLRMRHYQAMSVLKQLVDEKYHIHLHPGDLSEVIEPENNVYSNKKMTPLLDNQNYKYEKDVTLSKSIAGKNLNGSFNFENEKMLNTNVNAHKNETKKDDTVHFAEEGCTPKINYEELESATEGWQKKNLLGKGGFGTVYKGLWKNTQVAIKRLEIQAGGGDMEVKCKTQRNQLFNELYNLNSCKHDNILPLYGYSVNGLHNCLVYQYMPNGSLEDRLLCKGDTKPLQWMQRHCIATGVARGLQFLHAVGFRLKPLVHGDIKSANILLDKFMVPKIGDFGLAREGPIENYTHIKVSKVHGTRPYLPIEFLRYRKFSTKVDTYSFGIVLFELASGLRAYDDSRLNKLLRDHVYSFLDENIFGLRDPKAGFDDYISFPAFVKLGKSCTSEKPKERPEMVVVLEELENILRTLEMSHQGCNGIRNYSSNSPGSPYEFPDISVHRRVTGSPKPAVKNREFHIHSPPEKNVTKSSTESCNPKEFEEIKTESTNVPVIPSPVITVHPPSCDNSANIPALTELLGGP